MKGTERHRLKDNEFATLALRVQREVESRPREILYIVVAVVVIGVGALAYFGWTSGVENRAAGALAGATAVFDEPVGVVEGQPAPPRFATERARQEEVVTSFKAVADQYPSTDAGRLARYREASAVMALGRPADAVPLYQQVVDAAGTAPLGQMARLGLAEAHAQAGQHDEAIAEYEGLVASPSGAMPVEGVLMELARAYRGAGRADDARKTFSRVVEEFGSSAFQAEAQRELTLLGES